MRLPVQRAAVRVFDQHVRRCRDELTGMAVGGPNDRLQQVRGPFNTPKHAARDACPCQIPRRTTHALQQKDGYIHPLLSCILSWAEFTLKGKKTNSKMLPLKSYLSVIKLLRFRKIVSKSVQ